MFARLGLLVGWGGLVAAWLLFAVPGDVVDAAIGLVVATACVALVCRVAPALGLRERRLSMPAAGLLAAVPGDVLSGTVRVLLGRWPGRRRALPVREDWLSTQGDRALVGLLLTLGPATYLVADDPLTVHQLGAGAGAVADRLRR